MSGVLGDVRVQKKLLLVVLLLPGFFSSVTKVFFVAWDAHQVVPGLTGVPPSSAAVGQCSLFQVFVGTRMKFKTV